VEFTGDDEETYYVVQTSKHFELLAEKKPANKTTTETSSGSNSGSGNTFSKILDIAQGLFGLFGGSKTTTKTGTGTSNTETGDEKPKAEEEPKEQENKYLAFLKKNIIWFLPTVILVPILLFWLIRWAIIKMKKTPVTPSSNGV
jgi:hypothetical protein